MPDNSDIFVVSAPSGTGKTTLNRRLLKEAADTIEMSVSYTDRPIRPGEKDGVDYRFVTTEQFETLIASKQMLEYAKVFGDYKGTSLREIDRIRGLGKRVLLEIDVQGWRQAKEKLPGAVSVFVLPPTVEDLWRRLSLRATEEPAKRWRRLMTAKEEIKAGHLYRYFIVNDDLERAYRELYDIVILGKKGAISGAAGKDLCARLLGEFETAPWLRKLSQEFADK